MKQHDDSRKGTFNSGGRHIDDHSFWAGGPGKDMVMPQGVHTKNESSAEGSGSVMRYEDTTEAIKGSQEMAKGKVKSHGRKEYQRN